MLQFTYRVIQLNRLSWRRFVKQPNLVVLRRCLGNLPVEVEQRIDGLTPDQIDALTDTLLDIQSVDQVAAWLSHQTSQ